MRLFFDSEFNHPKLYVNGVEVGFDEDVNAALDVVVGEFFVKFCGCFCATV